MNPIRLWSLIQQGVLGVIERYFGGPKPKASLMSTVTAHLAPSGQIRQDELAEMTTIAKRGLSAAGTIQRTGNVSSPTIPEVPANVTERQYRYRIAVNVEGGGVSKRIAPSIISPETMNKRDLFNQVAGELRGELGHDWYDTVVRQLLQQGATQVTPEVVISAYLEVPLSEYP